VTVKVVPATAAALSETFRGWNPSRAGLKRLHSWTVVSVYVSTTGSKGGSRTAVREERRGEREKRKG
jgi:hypothetical protein